MKCWLRFLFILLVLIYVTSPCGAADFTGRTFYFIVIDRFCDGDPSNNPAPPIFSPNRSNWRVYWGGDLRGIISKLDYLQALGISGLWITPVIDNTDFAYVHDGNITAAYHGYWGRDFRALNRFLGTMDELDELIRECKKRDIALILDIVLNHTSPTGQGCDGALYDRGRLIASYSRDGMRMFHHNGGIDFSRGIPGNCQEKNLFDLADLDQHNAFVDRYLKDTYGDWLKRGFDGFRIDTARYLDPLWLRSFADEMRAIDPDTYLVSEWSDAGGDVPESAEFERISATRLIDFRFRWEVTEIFNHGKPLTALPTLLSHDRNLAEPFESLTFLDSHDCPRFLSKAIISGASPARARRRLEAATYLMLMCRGIPCIYYGTEQYLHNESPARWDQGGEPYCRQMMSSFDRNSSFFRTIRKLAGLRRSSGALSRGIQRTLLAEKEIYMFERTTTGLPGSEKRYDTVITAVNTGTRMCRQVKVDLPDGEWESIIGPPMVVRNGSASITLDPLEVQVTSFPALPMK